MVAYKRDPLMGKVFDIYDEMCAQSGWNYNKMSAMESNLQAINDNTNGLEGITGDIRTLITTLNSAVATAANQATGNATLSNISSFVDGIEGLITSLNGVVATSAKQDTLLTAINALKASVDSLPQSEATSINTETSNISIGIGGNILVRTGPWKLWCFSGGAAFTILDNATTKWNVLVSGNSPSIVPLRGTHSLRVSALVAVNVNLQHSAA